MVEESVFRVADASDAGDARSEESYSDMKERV
jgi:hypothetical protein